MYIDQDDDANECFVKDKSHENESLTTSVSDNTFYDTDGASNFLKRSQRNDNDSNVARYGRKIDEHDDVHTFMMSDWASTAAEDTSFYDDRSSALKSLVGPEFRSPITSNKSSRGAYL